MARARGRGARHHAGRPAAVASHHGNRGHARPRFATGSPSTRTRGRATPCLPCRPGCRWRRRTRSPVRSSPATRRRRTGAATGRTGRRAGEPGRPARRAPPAGRARWRRGGDRRLGYVDLRRARRRVGARGRPPARRGRAPWRSGGRGGARRAGVVRGVPRRRQARGRGGAARGVRPPHGRHARPTSTPAWWSARTARRFRTTRCAWTRRSSRTASSCPWRPCTRRTSPT